MPDHREEVSWDDIGQGAKNVVPLYKDQTGCGESSVTKVLVNMRTQVQSPESSCHV